MSLSSKNSRQTPNAHGHHVQVFNIFKECLLQLSCKDCVYLPSIGDDTLKRHTNRNISLFFESLQIGFPPKNNNSNL